MTKKEIVEKMIELQQLDVCHGRWRFMPEIGDDDEVPPQQASVGVIYAWGGVHLLNITNETPNATDCAKWIAEYHNLFDAILEELSK